MPSPIIEPVKLAPLICIDPLLSHLVKSQYFKEEYLKSVQHIQFPTKEEPSKVLPKKHDILG